MSGASDNQHWWETIDSHNPPRPPSMVEVASSSCEAAVLRADAKELGFRPEDIPPAEPSVLFKVDSRVATYCLAICKTKEYRDQFQYVYPAERYK